MQRSTASSASSSSDVETGLDARYAGSDDEEESRILGSTGTSTTPYGRGLGSSVSSRASYTGGPSRRDGRHSVAAGVGGSGAMTLREQEKVSEDMEYVLVTLADCSNRNLMP